MAVQQPLTPAAPPFPAMSPAEEDSLIHSRLMNDERNLRRVAKRFHAVADAGPSSAARDKEREALLDDLAAFQSSLRARALVCDAERRQVLHYEDERQRIEVEQETLRGELVQLKNELEVEQVHRKRKLEYDGIAELIHKLAPRNELEESITTLEDEIATIEAQLEVENNAMLIRKTAFDALVSELQTLRLMGKEAEPDEPELELPDARARSGSPTDGERDDEDDPRRKRETVTTAPEHGEAGSVPGTPHPTSLNPSARPFKSRLLSDLSRPGTPMDSPAPASSEREEGEEPSQEEPGAATDGDIEMGEVVEGNPAASASGAEREEGETSPMTPLSMQDGEVP